MNGNFVFAKTETEPKKVDGYFTTEDILFSIIELKLRKIVHNQYEKEMLINPVRVEDIAIMQKQNGTGNYDGWY